MEFNWAIEEAKKIENSEDIAILEKPDIKTDLDDILIKKYWPAIDNSLKRISPYARNP